MTLTLIATPPSDATWRCDVSWSLTGPRISWSSSLSRRNLSWWAATAAAASPGCCWAQSVPRSPNLLACRWLSPDRR